VSSNSALFMTVFVDILWAVFPLCLWRLLVTLCE